MVAAAGASAFSASIFHLFTHAFFKALLFLGAGSVILGMHHEQDMRKMGGLWKHMPVTYITFLMGSLALVAIPPFSGFYSKDVLIEVEAVSNLPGSGYAYYCLLIGAFVTGLYTFRAFFMTFHGKPRFDADTLEHLKESPWVVWLPLVFLAIPSVMAGFVWSSGFIFSHDFLLNHGVVVLPQYNTVAMVAHELLSPKNMLLTAYKHSIFWITVAGIVVAWIGYILIPRLPEVASRLGAPFYKILVWKYGFDEFNRIVFVNGTRRLSDKLYEIVDMKLIDGLMINGSGRMIAWFSTIARRFQTGYVYHYIFVMFIGLVALVWWLLF
jgi:NADH-quinone oxidoreductase subunit L